MRAPRSRQSLVGIGEQLRCVYCVRLLAALLDQGVDDTELGARLGIEILLRLRLSLQSPEVGHCLVVLSQAQEHVAGIHQDDAMQPVRRHGFELRLRLLQGALSASEIGAGGNVELSLDDTRTRAYFRILCTSGKSGDALDLLRCAANPTGLVEHRLKIRARQHFTPDITRHLEASGRVVIQPFCGIAVSRRSNRSPHKDDPVDLRMLCGQSLEMLAGDSHSPLATATSW